METIKLTIDNKEIDVPKGTTILKAAKELGIDIPTLCYMDLHDMNIENKPGGCRICAVEVQKRRNLAPACSTKCEEGMVVSTHTPRVLNARRTVMEFILSDHPKECLTCLLNLIMHFWFSSPEFSEWWIQLYYRVPVLLREMHCNYQIL